MASAASKVQRLSVLALIPIIVPLAAGGAGYAAWRIQWATFLRYFFYGPGRVRRILLLLFAIFNWKNMPFSWTARVFSAIFYHNTFRKSPHHSPASLFRPMISHSHAPLLEIDYNMHKSNSTYFSDLDVSRSHLVSYLCHRGMRRVAYNHINKLVLDPQTQVPVQGQFGIMLGAVHCTFHREIPPYVSYEMWTRLLSWDRKWLYMVTHFAPKGLGRPTEWLDPRLGAVKGKTAVAAGWEKKIYATAVSKYVFKLGRFTIHPAIVLEESGLLPERPGGWRGENLNVVENGDAIPSVPGGDAWDWRRVEHQRQKGMEFAVQFLAMDSLVQSFEGGHGAALGKLGQW